MAFKIPESPNIIGGQTVLRQPTKLSGTSVTPDFSTDIKAPTEALANVATAYAQYVGEQNDILLTEVQNQYLRRMSAAVNDIKANNKLGMAADLYPKMKEASDKIAKDLTGVGKDDGRVRIANKEIQQQFYQWVAEQQPTYISNAATYGASEMAKYRDIVNDENDNILTQQIVDADSEITIQNAIQGLMRSAQRRYAGADPRHIASYAAAKVDSAVSARLLKDIPNDPIGVINALRTNKTVVDSLTSESKATLYGEAVKSYEGLAARYLAESIATNGTSGSEGLVDDGVMKHVYATDNKFELDEHKRSIEAKAKELANVYKKESEGIRANALSRTTNRFMTAKTYEEKQQALQQIANVDKQTAEVISNAWMEKEQFVKDLGEVGLAGGVEEIKRRVVENKTEYLLQVLDRKEAEYRSYLQQVEDPPAGSYQRLDGYQNLRAALKSGRVEDVEKFMIRSRMVSHDYVSGLTDADLELIDVNPEIYRRIMEHVDKRKDSLPKYIELSRRQATGEQIALDGALLEGMPAEYIDQLNSQALVMSNFYNRANEVKDVYGIDLKQMIQDEVPEYKNYTISSQNAFFRNVIQSLPKDGSMPGEMQLRALIRDAARTSVVPEEAKLYKVLLDHGYTTLQAKGIDPMLTPKAAREALDEASATSPYDLAFTTVSKANTYSKTSDRTYANDRKKAEEILDDYADELEPAQSNIVELYKDQLIDVVIAGEWSMLATIVMVQQ